MTNTDKWSTLSLNVKVCFSNPKFVKQIFQSLVELLAMSKDTFLDPTFLLKIYPNQFSFFVICVFSTASQRNRSQFVFDLCLVFVFCHPQSLGKGVISINLLVCKTLTTNISTSIIALSDHLYLKLVTVL